jgi:ABC-2 type transport system permease protein
MMALGIVTVFLMTFGITSLGIGLGAVFPRFRHENVAQIPTGFGGIVYMLLTMLYMGTVILLEAWPVSRIFMVQTMGARLTTGSWTLVVITSCLVVAVNILALTLPMKLGYQHLLKREV